ncbi:MAG: hypothetical protein BWX60_00442 [Candidatus Marinimicrobia bacterium ADurb.Bin030]|nr:MAG: hypothetical protein BWX60_00442 [Candidatus Marinimicrobia bacterium ADurb.Bin030]
MNGELILRYCLAYKGGYMKSKFLAATLLCAILIPIMGFGQSFFDERTTVTERDRLIYSMKYAQADEDTFVFNYEKSPGLAFFLSAVVPGAGEFYAGAKYRAAAFFSVEVVSWVGYFNRKNNGEKLERKYMNWANTYWDAWQWYENSLSYPEYFGLSDSGSGFGSHTIYFEYEGKEYKADVSYLDRELPGWQTYLQEGTLKPIKTRDYYENIGKYDQFASGWSDFDQIASEVDSLNIPTSPLRKKYLNQRYESNQSLKMATNFTTVIMFNHLISAFHAQIAAKNYRPPEQKDVSWHVGLVTDCTYKMPIRGLSLSVAF